MALGDEASHVGSSVNSGPMLGPLYSTAAEGPQKGTLI